MSDDFRVRPSDLSLTITEEALGNMEKNIKSECMNQHCVIVSCGHWERETGSVYHPGSLSTSPIPIRLGLTGVRKKLQK